MAHLVFIEIMSTWCWNSVVKATMMCKKAKIHLQEEDIPLSFHSSAAHSQGQTYILTLALAVTNILSGLVWLSIRPKYISSVVPQVVECKRINSKIANYAVLELLWVWESLSATTCCRSIVVMHGGYCLLQIGVAAESLTEVGQAVAVDVHKLIQTAVYRSVIESRKQSYLANLSLYPARSELPFLPANTQAVILQPLGNSGIAIIGGDTIRGFTNLDQASMWKWICRCDAKEFRNPSKRGQEKNGWSI